MQGLDLSSPSGFFVIPAKAGIQSISTHIYELNNWQLNSESPPP